MALGIDEKQYGALLAERLPRRIENDAEYDYWAGIVEEIDFRESASGEERALSELMSIALEDYDRRVHPEEFASSGFGAPVETLRHLMEANGMTQADLARLLDVARATASQIYHGQRGISKAVAVKLAERFRLEVGAFIG